MALQKTFFKGKSGLNPKDIRYIASLLCILKKGKGLFIDGNKDVVKDGIFPSLSRDLNTGPADYKSAALPTKPLRRHIQ
jgi:hypothetical protein